MEWLQHGGNGWQGWGVAGAWMGVCARTSEGTGRSDCNQPDSSWLLAFYMVGVPPWNPAIPDCMPCWMYREDSEMNNNWRESLHLAIAATGCVPLAVLAVMATIADRQQRWKALPSRALASAVRQQRWQALPSRALARAGQRCCPWQR